jgi:hypothetical protein
MWLTISVPPDNHRPRIMKVNELIGYYRDAFLDDASGHQ